jgi:hypothetical protein
VAKLEPSGGSTKLAAAARHGDASSVRLPIVSFERGVLSEREAAMLELVLRLGSLVVGLRSSGNDEADAALMTFVLGLAAKSFPDVAFEMTGAVDVPLEEIIG